MENILIKELDDFISLNIDIQNNYEIAETFAKNYINLITTYLTFLKKNNNIPKDINIFENTIKNFYKFYNLFKDVLINLNKDEFILKKINFLEKIFLKEIKKQYNINKKEKNEQQINISNIGETKDFY